jgi:CRISPR/Cas system-associated exonuclease Cas4 (RecB family)
MDFVPVHYLKLYAYCPRKLALKYRDKESATRKTNTAGNARREIARMLHREEHEIVAGTESVIPLPELVERYKQHYGKKTREIIAEYKDRMKEEGQNIPEFIKRLWPRIMRESEQRAENLHKVMERTGLYGNALWDGLSPKLRTDVLIEGLGMRGKIDLIKDYSSESRPYVFTAKKPPKYGVWDTDKLATGAYVLILRAQGIPCTEGRVVYLGEKGDAEREVPMNGFLQKRILETRDSVNKLLESKTIPPRCKRCTPDKPCYPETPNS